jgi:hypothetical protein
MNTYTVDFPENTPKPLKEITRLFLKGISLGVSRSNSTNQFSVLCIDDLITIKTDNRILIKKITMELNQFHIKVSIVSDKPQTVSNPQFSLTFN